MAMKLKNGLTGSFTTIHTDIVAIWLKLPPTVGGMTSAGIKAIYVRPTIN